MHPENELSSYSVKIIQKRKLRDYLARKALFTKLTIGVKSITGENMWHHSAMPPVQNC